MVTHIDFIGYASGAGAEYVQCEDGPLYCQQHHLEKVLQHDGMQAVWRAQVQPEVKGVHGGEEDILALCSVLSKQVQASLENQHFPVVIGGDHSMAIGTWHGVVKSCDARGKLGLLWVDAHMDAHTLSSSHSGNIHGMPFGYLLGYGEGEIHRFLDEMPVLSISHTVVFGVRSFESEEAAALTSLGVRIYYMDEIESRGLKTCWSEAVAIVSRAPAGFGLSFDIDVLDPADAPGTGTIEPDGILAKNMVPLLQELKHCPGFLALEIAEFNPHLDQNQKTYTIIQDILTHVI